MWQADVGAGSRMADESFWSAKGSGDVRELQRRDKFLTVVKATVNFEGDNGSTQTHLFFCKTVLGM